MKNKVLYITPHLSTGGMPKFLLKQIESIYKFFSIYVIEYENLGGDSYIAHKNKILPLLDGIFTLKGNNTSLYEFVTIFESINPNVVHLTEIPELFLGHPICGFLYQNKDKNYKLIETSHDSSFEIINKIYKPDEFLMVSKYQVDKYRQLGIKTQLLDYPVENKVRPDRENGLLKLGLDPSYKHVLNVGLFTPRKNQKEVVEYAKKFINEKIIFHFVGNYADNFKFYWEDIFKNLPKNCMVWGERDDVDSFYSCMDLFLFTSKGTDSDLETMPISLKEAIGWKMPVMMYNLNVYRGYFDKFLEVTYLKDFKNNIKTIFNFFDFKVSYKDLYIISSYPNTKASTDKTLECIKSCKEFGDVLLTTHYPKTSSSLIENSDYFIYDKNNILTKHKWYNNFLGYYKDFKIVHFFYDPYHGPAVYTNYLNGTIFAERFNYDRAFYINFDYVPKTENFKELLNKVDEAFINNDFYAGENIASDGIGAWTAFFVASPKKMLPLFKNIKSSEDFDSIQTGYTSNSFELVMGNFIKNQNVFYESHNNFESLLNNYFNFCEFSLAEYFSVLQDTLENNYLFIKTNNKKDSRYVEIYLNDDIFYSKIFIESEVFMLSKISSDFYKVTFIVYDIATNVVVKQKEVNKEEIKNNGYVRIKDQFKFDVKAVHLTTTLHMEKELKSIESISKLKKIGIEYVLHKNEIYKELPPIESCAFPKNVGMELVEGYLVLTPAHYGCFDSFRKAVLQEFSHYIDFIILFEGDTYIKEESTFKSTLEWILQEMLDKDIAAFSLGSRFWSEREHVLVSPTLEDCGKYVITDVLSNASCIILNRKYREKFIDIFSFSKWMAADEFMYTEFNKNNLKIGITKESLVDQFDGYSLVDKKEKFFKK